MSVPDADVVSRADRGVGWSTETDGDGVACALAEKASLATVAVTDEVAADCE